MTERTKARRLLGWLWKVAALTLGLCFALSWVVGSRLVAPANQTVGSPYAAAFPSDIPVVTTTIKSQSGSQLATWYVPNSNVSATVVLLHPVRGDRRSMLGRARLLHEAGYCLVLIDFQSHGESPGDAITVGYREKFDAAAAVAFARERNPSHRIGVVGRSLGGAAALLGSPLGIDALVLESVYPTISDAVQNRISMRLGPASHVLTPLLLTQMRMRLGIRSSDLRPIDKMDAIDCPLLVASGDQDTHTTLVETQRMFKAASEPKRIVVFDGAAHEDLLGYDPRKYHEQVLSFLDENLRQNN